MNIEVFADIWCPFTHVGLRTIAEQRAERGRPDVGIIVRAWPLELVNGAPMDPYKARDHAEELREQVAPTMFTKLDPEHFPTSTLDALALVHRAYQAGIAVGERASFGLRDALFEHGRDISDLAELRAIADELGIDMPHADDHAAVLADWEEGQQRGVLGSPHFFCGADHLFCPSLAITRDPEAGLIIDTDTARLSSFLDACLQ